MTIRNKRLAEDYLFRAQNRMKAVELLSSLESWADVIRESQEIAELATKALARYLNLEIPRLHDISFVLEQAEGDLPEPAKTKLSELTRPSRLLRRDREMAFDGAEDLTPSEFYRRDDAIAAMEQARLVLDIVRESMGHR